MNENLISIITPLYNREAFIEETIESVRSQKNVHWEYVIVDDGSTDASIEIVENYTRKDFRIKLYKRNRLPKGACTCRNIGIKEAKGKYIIFLDSDDLLLPFNLEQRVHVFKSKPLLDFHVFQVHRFKGDMSLLKHWNTNSYQDHLSRFLQVDPVWHTSGPIWKRKSLLNNGLFFDESLQVWQDLDYHIQALIKNMTYKINFDYPADVLYREHTDESISQKGYNKQQRDSQFHLIRKTFPNLAQKYKQHLKSLAKRLNQKNFQTRNWSTFLKLWWWQRVN